MVLDKKREEDPREKWVPVVGRFILSFGDIENVTYLALKQLPKDKIFESTSSLGFGKRIELILELIDGHPEIDEKLSKEFAENLRLAKTLSHTRNLVAHSPLVTKIYKHPKEGWTQREISLGNAKNIDESVSFEKLTAAADQAEILAKGLYKQYGSIYKQVTKK